MPPVDENEWISFRLDWQAKRDLRRAAETAGVSVSELLRELVDVYVEADTDAREAKAAH